MTKEQFYKLTNDATAEIVRLHRTYMPPVAGYVAVLNVIEALVKEAIEVEQKGEREPEAHHAER